MDAGLAEQGGQCHLDGKENRLGDLGTRELIRSHASEQRAGWLSAEVD